MTPPLPDAPLPDDDDARKAAENADTWPDDDTAADDDLDGDALPDDLPPEEAMALGIDIDEFADEAEAHAEPEPVADHTPAVAVDFFDAGPDAHALDDLTLDGRVAVLERLGPAQFRSKGFSFIGFLQTVYEHVAVETKGGPKPSDADRDTPAGPPATPPKPPAPEPTELHEQYGPRPDAFS